MPAYVVFTDATLEAIADDVPRRAASSRQISGVGATKLERYSDQVLALVAGSDVEEALAVGPEAVVESEPSDTTR